MGNEGFGVRRDTMVDFERIRKRIFRLSSSIALRRRGKEMRRNTGHVQIGGRRVKMEVFTQWESWED